MPTNDASMWQCSPGGSGDNRISEHIARETPGPGAARGGGFRFLTLMPD
jgi:hypothetical protein